MMSARKECQLRTQGFSDNYATLLVQWAFCIFEYFVGLYTYDVYYAGLRNAPSTKRVTVGIKATAISVINFLSRMSVVALLTCFCTSLNNGYTDSRMSTIRWIDYIESDKLRLMNIFVTNAASTWTQYSTGALQLGTSTSCDHPYQQGYLTIFNVPLAITVKA